MSTAPEPATEPPDVLARGPWPIDQARARSREEELGPSARHREAAGAAIGGLQSRGSPSHDGVAARLVDYQLQGEGIAIELQPLRWALRLGTGDASLSMAGACVT